MADLTPSDRARRAVEASWVGTTPEQRRARTANANEARGRVATALAEMAELRAELRKLRAEVAELRSDRVAA